MRKKILMAALRKCKADRMLLINELKLARNLLIAFERKKATRRDVKLMVIKINSRLKELEER